MKRAGIVVTVVFAVLALVAGFAGTTAALLITQPAVSGSNVTVNFEVKDGDTGVTVAQRLQQDGLIRNALAFRVLAHFRHLDKGIEQGVYELSPSMTMDQIIVKLQQAKPDFLLAGVPDGLRVTQYPKYFANLPGFNADNFLKIAKDGVFTDTNKPVSSEFWFVPNKGKDVAYALEGYLYPDTYAFQKKDDENAVVRRMLTELGEKLCPGPDGHPDQYLADHTQCHANAVKVNGVNIFDAMNQAYFTKDDVVGLQRTLTIASMTAREINNYSDAPGVAGVYYNRFLASLQKVPNDTGATMGSDPTVEYARDTDNPPQDGKWWKDLINVSGKDVDSGSLYNTESSPGLPPGPIAAPLWDEITAAANPKHYPDWPNFYFVSDKCGKIWYGKTKQEFDTVVVPKMNTGNC